jgi:hypothetical protein
MAARELETSCLIRLGREGHLHAPQGESISYLHVAQRLVEYDRDFEIPLCGLRPLRLPAL